MLIPTGWYNNRRRRPLYALKLQAANFWFLSPQIAQKYRSHAYSAKKKRGGDNGFISRVPEMKFSGNPSARNFRVRGGKKDVFNLARV